MPVSPSPTTAISRPDLAATLVEFNLQANQAGFIGLQLFPVIEVAEQSANIGRIPIEQLLQTQNTARASGGGYRRGNFRFEKFSYATEEHGWEEPVDERNRRIYRNYFDAESVAASRARNFVVQNHELRCVALATDTNTFVDEAATALFSDKASATPVADVIARVLAVRAACGLTPNTVAMDYEAYVAALETDEVIDRLKYNGITDVKNVTTTDLAKLFKVQRVLISGGQQNTAPEGGMALTASWTKSVVGVGYVPMTNDAAEPGLGRTYHWAEDGSAIGAAIESYRDETVRADIIRARMETDELVQHAECWQLITGVL